MQAALVSLLISHILTFVESEFMKAEPAMAAALVHDIQSLIIKLESLVSAKLPAEAPVLNGALSAVSAVASDAVQAVSAVIVDSAVAQVASAS
jgi:hypothetical protein